MTSLINVLDRHRVDVDPDPMFRLIRTIRCVQKADPVLDQDPIKPNFPDIDMTGSLYASTFLWHTLAKATWIKTRK